MTRSMTAKEQKMFRFTQFELSRPLIRPPKQRRRKSEEPYNMVADCSNCSIVDCDIV
jgi:hypothetical protein